jgi:SOS-response transcriptional repressor LexA
MDINAIRIINMEILQGDLKRKDFAAKIGIDYGQLGHYVTGVRNIGPRVARQIEQAFGKPHGWLDVVHPELRLPKRATLRHAAEPGGPSASVEAHQVLDGLHPYNVDEVRSPRSRLPLISWVSAGLKDEANDPYAPGNAEAWIDFDSEASASAFCLRVRGDSMVRPDGTGFPDGCIIAIEPKRRPKGGEFAVFRFNESDEATFKQFFQDGPLKMLRPLNPSYPPITLSGDWQLVGTVFEMRIIEKY